MFTSHIRKIKNTTDNKSNILNLLELISSTIYPIKTTVEEYKHTLQISSV